MHNLPELTAYYAACRAGVRAEARLGSPRLHNCAGIGICSIEPVAAVKGPTGSASFPAFVRLDPVTGRLLLHLETEAIPPMVLRRQFAGGTLRTVDACRLSPTIATALGLPDDPLYIAAGHYPVLDDGTFLTLSLGLTRTAFGSLGVRPAA